MIIATAGHVDHGKTHLIRALTGVDTDRLAEEKRRGMTIDLGFAYADLGGRLPTGFIDVPGHERFVRTMAAGVHRIDLALLVVAADDGPMPQTREHLDVLRWLGVNELVVVLTKIDRVDAGTLDQARSAVQVLLADGLWAQAPVFEVDNLSGAGLPALQSCLRERQRAFDAASCAVQGNARLAIDRAFHRPGAGLVVTGTLQSGRLSLGDSLVLSPRGGPVRVRGLRVHETASDTAQAGQRCAVNLAGNTIPANELGRGDWLVGADLAEPTTRLDAWLWTNASLDRALGEREQLQLHLGAACIGARVVPLASRALAPGEAGPVQFILDQPIIALHADRWVLRDPAAQRVIGGGIVLDPQGASRGRSKPERLDWLRVLLGPGHHGLTARDALQEGLMRAPCGIDRTSFCRAFNLTQHDWQALTAESGLLHIDTRVLSAAHGAGWCQTVSEAIERTHQQEPARVGPTQASLLQQAARTYAAQAGGAQARPIALWALQQLLHRGTVVRDGPCIRQADHRAVLSQTAQAQLEAVRIRLIEAGLRPPIAGELALALGTTREAMLAFLQEMGALGHLVPVAPNRYFLQEHVERLTEIARTLAQSSADGSFDAAAYRDASGIGRNLTIEVLEFLDRQGITRRLGQRRMMQPGN